MKVHRFAWWPVATTLLQPQVPQQVAIAPGEERAEPEDPVETDAEVEDTSDGI